MQTIKFNHIAAATLLVVTFFGWATPSIAQVSAADLKTAEKNFKLICMQCHAANGMGKAPINPTTKKPMVNAMMGPQIAGLNAAYALAQIKAVQAGTRKNVNTISMKSKVAKLSNAEITALAEYLSKHLNAKATPIKGMLEN